MIESKNHVGELHCSLFPYYALTNWIAALRAYQLDEINIIIRLWMVVGLIGGAHGHFMDLYQVLKGDPQGWLEVKKPGKVGQFMGLALLGFPSLLGIYAMVYLYITNISFWTSESYFLVILSLITVGYDLYFVSFWNTSFWWHQNHVFAHCTFLISEYAACGYLAFKGIDTFSFFGIQAVISICIEILLFFPGLAFKLPDKDKDTGKLKKYDEQNMKNGVIVSMGIFSLAFILDYLIKSKNPSMYIPGTPISMQ